MEDVDGSSLTRRTDRITNEGDMVSAPLFTSGSVHVDNVSRMSVKIKKREKSNPYEYYPQCTNTVQKVKQKDRDECIEATIEILELILKLKRPIGMVLNPDRVSVPSKEPGILNLIKTEDDSGKERASGEVTVCKSMEDMALKTASEEDDLPTVGTVLGKGNASGEVVVVKDRDTQKKMALKTIMLSQFHRDEIWAWIHLMDEGKAPELYHFHLQDYKVVFTMEIMEGKTLQEVIDSRNLSDPMEARQLSLCVLNDLLSTFESLRARDYTHGDMHGGNVMVSPSLSLKLFDFGTARKLLKDAAKDSRRIKNDIIGIIRMFCAVYSGFDFYDLDEARKVLQANDLEEISEYMQHIPEDQRKELFSIMSMLFDTVRDEKQPQFGDTSQVAAHVQSLLPEDIKNWKKKAAVIIFPEKFQMKDQADFGMEGEAETVVGENFNPIWDSPDMEDFVDNVTDRELQKLGVSLRLLDDESDI